MTDSYNIIISISHHRISFEYYLKGGDDALMPMPPGVWPAPLAFYCSPTGIIIGEDAARAAQSGMSNAFIDYFNLLPQTDKFYEIGGERKPIGKMLLDASETLFRDFFSSVLLNRNGNLNDNRLKMPLTIVCEPDIKTNERVYIKNTFKDSGYGKVNVVNYQTYIEKYIKETLSNEFSCDKVLVAWSESNDINLTLFDTKGNTNPISKMYPGLGVDPRLNFVMNKIWNCVNGQNPWLSYEEESQIIQKAAIDFLNSTQPLINDEILLSDGRKYSYSLLRNNIDFIQCSESIALKKGLENFLSENSIYDKNSVLLLLRGAAAGNSYFESTIGNGFRSVIRSDKELRSKTMKLIILQSDATSELSLPTEDPIIPEAKEISPSGRDKREYKELEMTVRTFISNNKFSAALAEIDRFVERMHSKSIHAFDEDILKLKAQIKPKENDNLIIKEPQSTVSSEPSGMDKRAFKIAKADAESALTNGNCTKAQDILRKFSKEMQSKGIIAFSNEIESLLSHYSKQAKSNTTNAPSKTSSAPKPSNAKQKKEVAPSSRDQRDFRILQKLIESKLAQADKAAAMKELKNFTSSILTKGITAFDKELKSLSDKINSTKK